MSVISMYRPRSLSRCYGTWHVQDICSLIMVGNDQPARLLCSFSFSSGTFWEASLMWKEARLTFHSFPFILSYCDGLNAHPAALLSGQTTETLLFEWIIRAWRRRQLSVWKGISMYNTTRAETRTGEGLNCRHKPQHFINTWCQKLRV
jgi:hypothetical protein